jgi:hypothetical protein
LHGFGDWPERVQSFRCGSDAAHVAETSSIFGGATLVQLCEMAET